MANKVEFGISELHVGTWTESGGTITLGTPYHQKGAVSFAPEVNESQNNFYADNIVYWSGYSGGTIEGDLEVAMFDDKFKKDFLGYKELTDPESGPPGGGRRQFQTQKGCTAASQQSR